MVIMVVYVSVYKVGIDTSIKTISILVVLEFIFKLLVTMILLFLQAIGVTQKAIHSQEGRK